MYTWRCALGLYVQHKPTWTATTRAATACFLGAGGCGFPGTLAAFDARACAYRIEYDDDVDDETSFEPSREVRSLVKCRHRARLKRRPKRAEVRSFVVRERAECTPAARISVSLHFVVD
ncbi:hypothetical protein BE221DRAFT_64976 [Ostreococcus tauri]|uniref:Uncharacterized protein n=1 Tax=Ostreococcus tauri TaxID=70448 RepID=A0A1Y5I0T9_OSTTA|nr:hypothetical protein BE221DRAFT_64976 [Ostreococcus tauri]